MAAEQSFRASKGVQSLWKSWLSNGLKRGDLYEVIYADGGT